MSRTTQVGPPTSSVRLVSGGPLVTAPGDDDMDSLLDVPPAIANGVGVVALLIGLFWMIARGSLVTRREHEARVGDLKEQNATLKTTVDVKDKQLQDLAVVGETVIKIMASVDELARKGQGQRR